MSDAILGHVALCYSPFIDRKRDISATRLTVFPLDAELACDAGALLDVVASVWPAGGARVALNVLSEPLLHAVLHTRPPANVMLEVPAFMAADEALGPALRGLHANGNLLLIKGRPLQELPREALPCFAYSIVEPDEDRRIAETRAMPPPGVARRIEVVQSGVRSVADMEAGFARGAAAVLGWPIDDPITEGTRRERAASQADLQVIVELIRRVDAQEPIEQLENTLRRDPSLAYKLMRYINSPAFGLRVEISSFRHAIMMLGYQRLKRWLALLLSTASRDASLRPVMFAAVRRGLLMEELVRDHGDEEMRNELFICGVFSLLDRIFRQPFDELLKTIPVPERVYQALAGASGPYQPYAELVRAVEQESLFDYRAAAERLLMSAGEINRAQLRALAAAAQLE